MYERFTDRARKVMQLANQEAHVNHEYVGTEHVLLGLIKEGAGVAANVLKNFHVDLARIRLEVEKIVLSGPDRVTTGKLPQTPRAKKVIEYAIDEARHLGHSYVGTEHLLLGLLCEEEGLAAQILMDLGLKPVDVREEVLDLLGAVTRLPARERNLPESNMLIEDLPADVQRTLTELDAQIERLNARKEEAVVEGDFEKAAHLRDQADRLKKRKRALLATWPMDHPIDPSWLAWNGGTVARIAQDIREATHWQDLPVLADALEDAGCADSDILNHCRQPGEHATRCWVVELLLGKV